MKKLWGFLVLFLGLLPLMPAQESNPVDLVLVLDTSSSMSGSYQEVVQYITGPFLKEFLRIGDTFHLVSFSDIPRAEISRRVEGTGDVETIIARMLLMYPLDIYSDIPGALEYSERYVASLPGARPKKVIFISDGDHSPGPGSSRSGLDAAAVQKSITDAGSRLRQRGVDFYFVKVPLAGSGPSSGRPWRALESPAQTRQAQAGRSGEGPAAGAAAETRTAQAGTAGTATDSGQARPGNQGPATGAAAETRTAQAGTAGTATDSGQARPGDQGPAAGTAAETRTAQADTAGTPADSGPARPGDQGPAGIRSGAEGALGSQGLSPFISLPLLIGLILGALLIIAFIVVLIRRLQNSPNRVIASAANAEPRRGSQGGISGARDDSANRNAELLASYAANQRQGAAQASSRRISLQDSQTAFLPTDGPPMLSLFVEGQSTAIGRRNIHAAKEGVTYSVGGGTSDFLVFLVPMPPRIADIHFDGSQCTFIPRKPQFFPDIGSQSIPNAIGKAIRLLSDKKYEFFIRIDRYQDPLIALNRLMHSVEVPEK
jgi:hypothetical protein